MSRIMVCSSTSIRKVLLLIACIVVLLLLGGVTGDATATPSPTFVHDEFITPINTATGTVDCMYHPDFFLLWKVV